MCHSRCETFSTEHAIPSFHLTNPFSFNLHFTSFQVLWNDGAGGRLRPYVNTRLSVKISVSGPCRQRLNTLYDRFLTGRHFATPIVSPGAFSTVQSLDIGAGVGHLPLRSMEYDSQSYRAEISKCP
jgi:hypothetical protein